MFHKRPEGNSGLPAVLDGLLLLLTASALSKASLKFWAIKSIVFWHRENAENAMFLCEVHMPVAQLVLFLFTAMPSFWVEVGYAKTKHVQMTCSKPCKFS